MRLRSTFLNQCVDFDLHVMNRNAFRYMYKQMRLRNPNMAQWRVKHHIFMRAAFLTNQHLSLFKGGTS